MYSREYSYQRVGSWLLVLKIYAIIQIIGSGLSLIYALVIAAGSRLLAVGSLALLFTRYQVFAYLLGTAIGAIVSCVLSSLILYYLSKRQLRPFKIVVLLQWGGYAVGWALYCVVFILGNNSISLIVQSLRSLFISGGFSAYAFDSIASVYMVAYFILYIVGALLRIAYFIGWCLYLNRSRRVQVYFGLSAPQLQNAYPLPPPFPTSYPVAGTSPYYNGPQTTYPQQQAPPPPPAG